MILRGEFYEHAPTDGGRPRYVVVLSDDAMNAASWPVCAPVVRGLSGSLWLVPLAVSDPVSGLVALHALAAHDPARLTGPHGMVSGVTFDRITSGIREMFGV